MPDQNPTAERPVRRGHFEAVSEREDWAKGCYEDGELEITSGEHGVSFNINDEAAAGSYNIDVTASCRLLRSEAERLKDWLIEVLS